MKEKRRLTLDELKSLPPILWMLELAQIWIEANATGQTEIAEEADLLPTDEDLTPEKIVALGERLRCATGSTVLQPAAPAAQPDAA